jgi:hypothetical protein
LSNTRMSCGFSIATCVSVSNYTSTPPRCMHRSNGHARPTCYRDLLTGSAAEKGAMTRDVPTAYAASPLKEQIVPDGEPVPVWPYAEGTVRGYSFSPLHKNAPLAALEDPRLYELLALVDAMRDGRARERELAGRELKLRIEPAPHAASKS